MLYIRFSIFVMVTLSNLAAAGELQVSELVRFETSAVPTLVTNGHRVAVAINAERTIHVYEVSDRQLRLLERLPGWMGNISMTLHKEGDWVANCGSLGNRLQVFRFSKPSESLVEFDWSQSESTNCAGLAFGLGMPNAPHMWLGATGSRAIVKIDFAGRELFRHKEVSGPFFILQRGNLLFATNSPLQGRSMPLVIEATGERTLIGSRSGRLSETSMRREYRPAVFDDSANSGKMLFINRDFPQLLEVDAELPSEGTSRIVELPIAMPNAVFRLGKCLGVVGQTEPNLSNWKVALLQRDPASGFQVAAEGTFQTNQITSLVNAAVADGPTVILTHSSGLVRLDGLDDLLKQAGYCDRSKINSTLTTKSRL
jgi:hypothetical protein